MYLNPDRVMRYCGAYPTFWNGNGLQVDPNDIGQWMIWVLERSYLWGDEGWPKHWAER